MLYLTFTIDRQAVGFAEREAELTAQAKRVAEVQRDQRDQRDRKTTRRRTSSIFIHS